MIEILIILGGILPFATMFIYKTISLYLRNKKDVERIINFIRDELPKLSVEIIGTSMSEPNKTKFESSRNAKKSYITWHIVPQFGTHIPSSEVKIRMVSFDNDNGDITIVEIGNTKQTHSKKSVELLHGMLIGLSNEIYVLDKLDS
jgi:hypothetical protein